MADQIFDIADDLQSIRVEQARALKQNAIKSAATLEISVVTYTILIAACVSIPTGLTWFVLANLMVSVTLLYAKFRALEGITDHNYKAYLFGHIIICAITGMLWGGFAIHIFNYDDPFVFLVAITLPVTLTIGGMLPSSVYRPGYIALAIFALLPLGFYLTVTLLGASRIFGLGLIIFFGFGVLASARAELNTRDGIVARRVQALSKNLYEKNLEIERVNEEKSRFLISTSHDFAQPLHAQGFYIDALAKQLNTKDQQTLLDKIQGAWQAQKDLLDGLAEVTRLESGAIIPSLSIFEITPVIEAVLSNLMAELSVKEISIETRLDNSVVFSDPALVTRIIRNILHNAVKFTDEQGRVEIVSFTKGEHVHLSIKDTGAGIQLDDQERIFEAYYQLPQGQKSEGTGLGLAIVKRLCELLEITFELSSAKAKGTSFTFRLPISSRNLSTDEFSADETLKFQNTPFVVLIDDNDHIRESMLAELTSWGVTVIASPNTKDAISLMSKTLEVPTLLIVDKSLSQNEDGIETVFALREELNEETAAILMTGDITGFDEISSEDNIQIILKPVRPMDLKRLMWQILTR